MGGRGRRIGRSERDAEPYAYPVDLFTRIANGHLHKEINVLMPWANIPATKPEIASTPGKCPHP
ncbi:hypothetical protein C8J28_1143 [Cereibacter azotoformans]|uniref:Transposase domain-containing protein n=1 Tax=Cereibacter azotoformans TaxID=43057 RepID=A0A2T5JYM7_9RHOB|nr:hypothetical protein C8J28_1143 [Cereibacter azotoformans]